ncbi:CLUMA_CG009715, isoform A [Clunio marinus]|uniref:Small ribosomal subunit protein bS16m n=1 Tax=Clunio marinus TaxID=568069 RepID=A0A1J1I7L1_9DIPT|nr:CLUMA_CG009715, isoform A [Clunio marinus]
MLLKIFLLLNAYIFPMCMGEFYTNYSIDVVNYFKMPLLNKFDDYEGCMKVYNDKAKYCYVRTALKPDPSSKLYNFIWEFSNRKKQHFRHDKLTRGICVNRCMEAIKELGSEAEEFFVENFKLDYKINFDFINYANSSEDRKKYNKIINQCINVELMELYDLKGFSSIEYCTTNRNATKIDWLDIFFIIAFSILLTIVIISSAYDKRLLIQMNKTSKIRIEAERHLKTAPPTLKQKLLVSFSYHRNWYLLSAPVKSEMRDLRSISAIRIWTMIPIIYGHCSWFMVAVPLQNPFFVENSYHSLWSMLVINGGNLVQSFFFISGFLNSIVLLSYVDKNKIKNFSILVKTIIYRYIRFVPVLIFVILLHSSWLHRFDSGPFWNKFTYYERQSCRLNWWTNILLINNYISGDMKCAVHTWFISTDFHLSIIATGILLLVINYPKRRNLIFFGSVFISFVISFIHFYITKLEPILILSPETLRNQLIVTSPYDRYFYEFHSPTHLNTGNYLIGVIIGYFYYQYKEAGNNHRKKAAYHVLWHLSYMMTFFLCFIGIYFYENDIEKGFKSALIGAILKHIYAPILGVLLVGIFFRYGHYIPKLYNYGMYRILARVSFSVYMIHYTVGLVLVTGQQYPLEINNATLNVYTAGVYVLSHGYAISLALCIELPAYVIYKSITDYLDNKKLQSQQKQGQSNDAFEGIGPSKLNIVTKSFVMLSQSILSEDMRNIFLISACILFSIGSTLSYQLDVKSYYKMPDLYRFDDYEQCLGADYEESTYCVVNSYIKPAKSSDLYQIIEEFSSNFKQHLRHDKLQRGLCIQSCEATVRKLTNDTAKYYVDEFPMDSKIIFENIKYPNADVDREKYRELINKCVNVELVSAFNLSAYSSVEYCVRGNREKPLDELEVFTRILIYAIISIVLFSSLYDRHLRNYSFDSHHHYEKKLKNKLERILTIFSIRRNWKKLSAPTKDDVKDLRFIEGLRSLIMFGVIHNHCSMFSITIPSSNPIFIDDTFSTSKAVSYMSGNPGVQTFLVIGGFLTAYLLMDKLEKNADSSYYEFFRGIISRYLRFAPLLIFTILIHATWLYRLGDGPFWDRVNYPEKQFCRKNWWVNLLFLDNYINVEEKCLIHTWYLAADFWLRILTTWCLIRIHKNRSLTIKIFSAVLGYSAIAIGYTVYVNKLEATSIFPPEDIRNQLMPTSDDKPNYFKILYSPTHLNIANYFIGAGAGLFYQRHKKQSEFHERSWIFRILWYFCLVGAFVIISSTYMFYTNTYEPSLWIALEAAIFKHVWGLVMSCIMLGIIYRYGWFASTMLNYPAYRILGRISYGTFMCHLFVVKLLMSSNHQPIYLSDWSIMTYAIASFVLSNLIGVVLTLSIDLPASTITSMILKEDQRLTMIYALASFILSNIIGLILTLFIELPINTIFSMLNLKQGLEMKSKDECDCEDVCNPISSIDQLLNDNGDAFRWCDLVEPLVERSTPRFLHKKFYSMDYGVYTNYAEKDRPEVLVCHDYKGNYLDDKFINGTPKWEEYRFYHWNCIDIFCYFSHKLVTIPTLQFINAAHKNGVKVLGTFIVENVDGRKALCDEILSSKTQVERVVNCLVEITKRLKIEGWLLNVEVTVDEDKIPMLYYLVEYLTHKTHKEIKHGKVIWYDSVTCEGKLNWQNELNEENESFFNRCDGIFTNYNWSVQHLERTSKLIDDKYPNRRNDVFFGIDVFGRGQIAGFRSPETISKLCAFKFSSAIFAPGWTCETIDAVIGFEGLHHGSDSYRDRFNERFLERNDRFWKSMYEFFYIFGPKTLPFVTNFCIGSGKRFYRMGREVKKNWFNLKHQGFQPSTPSLEGVFTHYYDDAFDGGSSLSLDTTDLIRMFVCEFPCDDDVIFAYTFKRSSGMNDVHVNLNISDIERNVDIQLVCGGKNSTNPFVMSCVSEEDVRTIAIFLANSRQVFIPSLINGWETRYFLLTFNSSTKALITDIGIKKLKRGRILIGHLAFYSAKNFNRNDFGHTGLDALSRLHINKLWPASGTGRYWRHSVKSIRFCKKGCTNRPFYQIVVMERRKHVQEPVIEQVGTYDPLPNQFNQRMVSLNYERIRYWLGSGAHVTRGVAELLGLSGLLPIYPKTYKDAWSKRRYHKAKEEAEKKAEAEKKEEAVSVSETQ